MAVAVLVPASAVGFLTPALHPSSWVLVGVMGVLLLQHDMRAEFLRLGRRHWVAVCILPAVLTLWLALDSLNVGGLGMKEILQIPAMYFIAPVVLFLLVQVGVATTPYAMRVVLGSLFALGLIQVLLVYRQSTLPGQEGFVWVSLNEHSWFWSDEWSVPMGSTSHPIQMGLFLAALTPLLALLRWVPLRFVLGSAYIFGASTASARAATVLAVVGIVFVIVYGIRRWAATAMIIAAAVPTASWFIQSTWVADLKNKFTDDGGSAQLRQDALRWSWHHREEFLYFGYPGGRDLRTQGVLRSSLENGYIMFAFYAGILCALLFMAYHLVMALRPAVTGGWPALPFVMSALICWGGFFGSSSFMSRALEWWTFWFVVGLAHAVAAQRREASPLEGEAGPDRSAADERGRAPAWS